MMQILVALHVRSVDVGGLRIHNIGRRVQILERVVPTLEQGSLRARGRLGKLPRIRLIVHERILLVDVPRKLGLRWVVRRNDAARPFVR